MTARVGFIPDRGTVVCVCVSLWHSGSEVKDMSVFEFLEMLQLASLCPHEISDRDSRASQPPSPPSWPRAVSSPPGAVCCCCAGQAFVNAVMLNPDEMESDAHMFLNRVEFLEAVRVCV